MISRTLTRDWPTAVSSPPAAAAGLPLPLLRFIEFSSTALRVEHAQSDYEQHQRVTIVRFREKRIVDAGNIEVIGDELLSLVKVQHLKNILLNFEGWNFFHRPRSISSFC